jgi:alkylhydroperoxidase family enzyme
VGRELGITDAQLRELSRYRDSDAFSPQERAVLNLAVAMTSDPVEVPPSVLDELRGFLDESQLVELAAAIAWENYRARFNRVFDVQPVGYSDGAACVLPTPRRPGSRE